MTWVLGIDTSSTDLGIGLYRDGLPAASYSRFLANSHAEHIERAVTTVLGENAIAPAGVSHIAIACGPGSFTGLRIGFSFIKGFCLRGAAKVALTPSLFILAHAARRYCGTVVAAIDARRDEVFWARFRFSAGVAGRETPDARCHAADFERSLLPDDTVVTDLMGYTRSTSFDFLRGRPGVFAVERFPVQRGLICAGYGASKLSDEASWLDASDAVPEYLRPFTPPAASSGGGQ